MSTTSRVLPWRRNQSAVIEDLVPLLSAYKRRNPKASVALINRAYEVASAAHQHQSRMSGELYISHPIAVARIVAEIGLDEMSLVAALLHDAVEDTEITLGDVETQFGAEVAGLVDGLTKLESDTKPKAAAKPSMDSDDDDEEEGEPVVKLKTKKDKKKKSKDDEDNFDDLRAKAKEAKASKAQAKEAARSKSNTKRDSTYDDESDDETTRKKNRKKASGGDDGFEVAPAERDVSSGSESDSGGFGYDSEVDELSDDTRARILALGKKMINKKEREELIEDGYNRYAFDDDDIPDWFAEDERKFMKPVPQYTAAELAEAKASLAAVNTRPIKKVAEAKWRKKKRAEAKIAQARNRAASIIEQDDVPDVSKAKEIERVFARARRSTSGAIKKPRKVVVARKYHRGNAGGPSVDKRQLADARGQKNAEKRKGGKHGRGRSTTRGKGKPKR